MLWSGGASPFQRFRQFSQWLHERTGRTDSIALVRLMELLFEFLTTELKLPSQTTAETLWRDYHHAGRQDKPPFLTKVLDGSNLATIPRVKQGSLPKRQARHAWQESR